MSINTSATKGHNTVKMFYVSTKYLEVHIHSSVPNTQPAVKYLEYKNLTILVQTKGNTPNSNSYLEPV